MTWLLLSAGRGPGECQIAVRGMLGRLIDEAAARGVEAEVVDAEDGPHGLLSALVSLRGGEAEALAAAWEGTALWVCPSPIRRGWKRKNWFVGVSRLSPPPPSSGLREDDLRFETMRASGPGGQHVNKTESAVRVTHLPTGLSFTAREERSQHRNKALAVARLSAALSGLREEALRGADRERWARHDSLVRGGAPSRVFRGDRFAG